MSGETLLESTIKESTQAAEVIRFSIIKLGFPTLDACWQMDEESWNDEFEFIKVSLIDIFRVLITKHPIITCKPFRIYTLVYCGVSINSPFFSYPT